MTASGIRFVRRPARGSDEANPHARALSNTLLATVPLLFIGVMAWAELHSRFSALDFRYAYWSAGHRVLHGQSPYLWTLAQFRTGVAFVYPPLSALVFAPLALVTRAAGAVVLTLLGLCVAPATLALLRVRDWRVYAVAAVWLPVCAGWLTANESLFMTLALAGVWHWRDHPRRAGFLTAAMLALKPLLWPLLLWLLATRRWRASAHTLAWSVLLNVTAFSVVGFGEVGRYLHAVSADTAGAWRLGFGVPALLGHLGAGRMAGIALMIILSLALAGAVLHSGLMRGNELRALTFAVALAIVSSPLLWSHYLALMLVPLALLRPRLNWLWAVPLAMWVSPPDVHALLWHVVLFWAAGALMFTTLLRRRSCPLDPAPAPLAGRQVEAFG